MTASRKLAAIAIATTLAGALTGALSAQTMLLDDFESGNLNAWNVVAGNPNATVTGAAAFSGQYGVAFGVAGGSQGWYVRNDINTSAGNLYTAFVRTVNPSADNGRVYLGVDAADGVGAISAVFAPNTGSLILQNNTGFGFSDIASVPMTIQAGDWYQLDLNWVGAGEMQARLWNEDRTVLLADTGVQNVPILGGGGITIRGFETTADANHLDDIWQNIPAPGALALLGLAGLLGARRRRN